MNVTKTLLAAIAVLLMCSPVMGEPAKRVIFMITYRGCEEACQGFKAALVRKMRNVEIVERDCALDIARLPTFVREVKQRRPDLVVTWGTSVTLGVVGPYDTKDSERYVLDIPTVFFIVSDPVGSRVVPSLSGHGRNITGTLYLIPVRRQLEAAALYRPFKRLGYIYNQRENNSRVVLQDLQQLAPSLGFEIRARPVPIAADGSLLPAAVPELVARLASENIDLLYQPPDSFLNKHSDILTKAALDHKIPVFAAAEGPIVKASALYGVVNSYEAVGQLTADVADRVLFQGQPASTIPIAAPRSFSYLVNLSAAKALQLWPPMRVLQIAEIHNQDQASRAVASNP
jgi:putative tryptophan/tyrosine transport system substrate-binding protein